MSEAQAGPRQPSISEMSDRELIEAAQERARGRTMITEEQVAAMLRSQDAADARQHAHERLRSIDWHAGFMDYEPILRDLQSKAMRAALEAAMPQWQPIRTAPEGRPFLVGRWVYHGGGNPAWIYRHLARGTEALRDDPGGWTHWCEPLPPPSEGS